MAVGLVLDNREEADAGGQVAADELDIAAQAAEVDLGPRRAEGK
jgi:hypothetical protein